MWLKEIGLCNSKSWILNYQIKFFFTFYFNTKVCNSVADVHSLSCQMYSAVKKYEIHEHFEEDKMKRSACYSRGKTTR